MLCGLAGWLAHRLIAMHTRCCYLFIYFLFTWPALAGPWQDVFCHVSELMEGEDSVKEGDEAAPRTQL